MDIFKKYGPYKLITMGFLLCIIIGSILLWLPISHNDGVNVSFVDAFFTTVSAICVTGLASIDLANSFNLFGKIIVALLIQIGGLGVVCAATSLIIISGQKIGIKKRMLIMNSLNLNSLKGVVKFVKTVIKITFTIELIGAVCSFIVFIKDYDFLRAIEISIFHSISAFNNAGFDILGDFQNLSNYRDNILINLITCSLIVLGGLGFIVINDVLEKKNIHKLQLHSKIVIKTTFILIIVGTLLIKLTGDLTLLESLFLSISSRTAGFNTYPISMLGISSLLVVMILMFIGASPSSTGGGIKTTTIYTLFKSSIAICSNKDCESFRRKISSDVINKSMVMLFSGICIVFITVFCLSISEPNFNLSNILFESISAFGTVGLSTGITPELATISKIILAITMFAGRIGPLTLLAIWSKKGKSNVSYPEENIMIG